MDTHLYSYYSSIMSTTPRMRDIVKSCSARYYCPAYYHHGKICRVFCDRCGTPDIQRSIGIDGDTIDLCMKCVAQIDEELTLVSPESDDSDELTFMMQQQFNTSSTPAQFR